MLFQEIFVRLSILRQFVQPFLLRRSKYLSRFDHRFQYCCPFREIGYPIHFLRCHLEIATKSKLCHALLELLQMLGLVFLELFVQLSTLLILLRFLPAPGFYEGRVPVPAYLYLMDSCA